MDTDVFLLLSLLVIGPEINVFFKPQFCTKAILGRGHPGVKMRTRVLFH